MDLWSKRFERFLLHRGIRSTVKEKITNTPLGSPPPTTNPNDSEVEPEARSVRYYPPPRSNQTLRDIDDIGIDFDDERVVDYFGLSRVESNPDADEFYEEMENPDKTEYVALESYRDRRYSRDPDQEENSHCSNGSDNDNDSDGDEEVDAEDEVFLTDSDESDGESEDLESTSRASTFASRLPINSQQGFKDWEFHDAITRSEIVLNGNGGVYDPFRPDLSIVDANDPFAMSRLAPAAKYRDLLRLDHYGVTKLHMLENSRKYKNNLSATLNDQYLITSSSSELIIYDFDKTTALPLRNPVLRFDIRPNITHTTDRLVSTWPYFPHTINYITTGEFLGQKVLGTCLDDGLVQIWYLDTIVEQIKRFKKKTKNKVGVYPRRNIGNLSGNRTENDNGHIELSLTDDDEVSPNSLFADSTNRFFGLRIKPDFTIKMGSSCWGLDFLSLHNMIVASDNSQCITLFYYHKDDERFYNVTSHQVLHNVPEVSFIGITEKNDSLVAKVSGSSISGEILIFEFEFRLLEGPLNLEDRSLFSNEKAHYIDTSIAMYQFLETMHIPTDEQRLLRFPRVQWESPRVVLRALLGEDCWTCKPVSSEFFKPVQSIRAMIGDPWLDEEKEIREIQIELRILKSECDPIKTSHLGSSAKWQFFESPVLHLNGPTFDSDTFDTVQLTGVDDNYRRIKKGLQKMDENKARKKSLNGRKYYKSATGCASDELFLAVSTSKRLGLFRADTLFCTAATRKVFDVSIPFNDDSKFSNRISITKIIPELLCFLALTQQGLVTVMRLCQHRGLYAMRQEHLFPNALSLALGYNGYRTITGMACRNMSPDSSLPRYYVYLTYSDGIVLTYELRLSKNDEIEVDMI